MTIPRAALGSLCGPARGDAFGDRWFSLFRAGRDDLLENRVRRPRRSGSGATAPPRRSPWSADWRRR